MKLSIIGTGYVGLVTGTCFAEMGNHVYCMDTDQIKIENLQNGIMPIYEPGLEELVLKNQKEKSLFFTADMQEALEQSSICFIAVGTPMSEDGSADLQYVFAAARGIGRCMVRDMIVVNKSTAPVGTADRIAEIITEELEKRNAGHNFNIVSNPEFLKEGVAIDDCIKPDRVVIGCNNKKAINVMKQLYAPFFRSRDGILIMDVRSAEMTKYAANAMLAARITLMNEIANICEKVGADVNKIRTGIGSDARIGYSFLFSGCGFGGSCFPKDVRALINMSKEQGYTPKMLESIEEVNNYQKKVIVEKIVKRFGDNLSGMTFAVWGLSFKPGTDDMREAPSITIIRALTEKGAKINAYDPKAMDEARNHYFNDNDSIKYADGKYSVLSGADALILITEWKEFRSPDFEEIEAKMKNKIIFDGRNQYNAAYLEELGFEYHQIGLRSGKKL